MLLVRRLDLGNRARGIVTPTEAHEAGRAAAARAAALEPCALGVVLESAKRELERGSHLAGQAQQRLEARALGAGVPAAIDLHAGVRLPPMRDGGVGSA